MNGVRIPSATWGPNQTDGPLERGGDMHVSQIRPDGTLPIVMVNSYGIVARALLDRAGRDALRAALAAMDHEEQG